MELLIAFGQLHQLTHLTLNGKALCYMQKEMINGNFNFQPIPQVTTLRLTEINWSEINNGEFRNACEALSSVFVSLKCLKIFQVERESDEDIIADFVTLASTKWNVEVDYFSNFIPRVFGR